MERHVGRGTFATTEHDELGLKLVAVREPQRQLVHQVYERVFGIVVHGEKRIELGDQRFNCRAGSLLISAVELPVGIQIAHASRDQPFLALAMSLRPKQVATLLLDAATADRMPVETAGMGICDASPDLIEAVVRYVRLLDQPRDLAVLAPLVEREILWRVLCSEQGHRLRLLGLADSRLSQIGRAMRWMREHYRETLRIDQLARIAAMSVTSFHRHFRAVALMSPLQYQKQIRLQEARASLLAGADDVARVGHAVGYDSPSQFSREYKRAYGSPPGQDARAGRLLIARGAHAVGSMTAPFIVPSTASR
ncbi:MAG TPA: AraC family transcriptional regulator [Kofleriaceae bacterium]|nr:AraC family transcriptional regulator [Kofleriaceae bacterium]